jgi:hypothetical protein
LGLDREVLFAIALNTVFHIIELSKVAHDTIGDP